MDTPVAAGLDGCPRGWAVVVVDADGDLELFRVDRVAAVVARFPGVVLAIDIPVGLADGPREADTAARRVLGSASPSVFNAPLRTVVDEVKAGALRSHAAANARARALAGKGLSAQTWHITAKVAEVDTLVETLEQPLLEVHPEVCFQALAGGVPPAPKRSYRGLRQRLRLLRTIGFCPPDDAADASTLSGDDVLDAAVAAWTAYGAARGERLRCFPAQPHQRDRGRPVAIWTRQPATGLADTG